MIEPTLKLIERLGGPIACAIIILCIADVALSVYSRSKNSKAARLWFQSTQAQWFENFKRLHLLKQGSRMDLVPDGPIVSTLFATGRKNMKYVCVEFEAPQNSDLVLLLSQFLLSRPLEYTLTLQVSITRTDAHGPMVIGILPNSTARGLAQSNWALSRIAKLTDIRGISDDHYTVLTDSKYLINALVSNPSIQAFLTRSQGKDSKGANLSIDDASLSPKIKYLIISDSFREAPLPNKKPLFTDTITVTLKTTIPSPHSQSPYIHEAYSSVLKFLLDIVDHIHTSSAVPQKVLTSLIAERQAAHDDPHGTAKKNAAEERHKRAAKIAEEKDKFIDSLPDDERQKYIDTMRQKDIKKRSMRMKMIGA